ncbi:MAG: hypothetical protein SOX31_08030 [Eubacteriales bacterium]|nr:hypothetical protein [Eubacteriales bacterium]
MEYIKIDSHRRTEKQEFLSLDGARTMAEEIAKKIPKIKVGRDEPVDLKGGEIYLQYE